MAQRKVPPANAIAVILCASAWAAWACSVPVFRYALERWESGEYELTIFHRGPLSPADKALLDELTRAAEDRAGPANLAIRTIDLAKPEAQIPKRARELWAAQNQPRGGDVRPAGTPAPPPLPWLVLALPDADGASEPPAWAGRLEGATSLALLHSPARAQISQKLLDGDSVVWVLLESGQKEKDDAASALLSGELKKLEQRLELPAQPKAGAGEEEFEAGPGRLHSDLPLRLAFPMLRVKRDDPEEAFLTRMLLQCDKDLEKQSGPIVVPVFGRGRALCGLAGDRLRAASIAEAAAFLIGACSCQVKELNPGIDLLMAVNWEKIFERANRTAGVSPALGAHNRRDAGGTASQQPAGVSESSGDSPVSGSRRDSPVPALPAASLPAAEPTVARNAGTRTMLKILTALAALLVIVTGAIALRSRKPPPFPPASGENDSSSRRLS